MIFIGERGFGAQISEFQGFNVTGIAGFCGQSLLDGKKEIARICGRSWTLKP
jgi:hypothetical protein